MLILYVILNEVKDLVPASPDEMLHCVQHDTREICELNYDAVYNLLIDKKIIITKVCIPAKIHRELLNSSSAGEYRERIMPKSTVFKISRVITAALIIQAPTLFAAGAEASLELDARQLDATHFQVEFYNNAEVQIAPADESFAVPITRWIALPDVGQTEIVLTRLSASDGIPTGNNSLNSGDLPHSAIELDGEIMVDGVRLAAVKFNPLIWQDNHPTAVVYLQAEFTLSAAPPLYRMRRVVREMWGGLLLNRDEPQRDRTNESADGLWVYVIPDLVEVRQAVAPLVAWRQAQGYPVREIAVSRWMDAESILMSLRGILQSGLNIDYVCLLGDVDGTYRVPAHINAGESDYYYALLEGSDLIPEAAVGRISYSSIAELQRIIAKILNYEQNPDLDNPEWLRRAAVAAGNELSGYSSILANQWVRAKLLDFGYTEVDTFWWTMGRGVAHFLENEFNRGVGFLNYRGWSGLEDWSVHAAGRLANRNLPVVLLLNCNSGDFASPVLSYTEALLRAPGGAVGAIGSVGAATRVHMNNALLASFYRGVLDDKIARLGWALNRAKLELISTYGARAQGAVNDHCRWTNLMGDPATVIWRGIPDAVNIQAPEQIDFGAGTVTAAVTRAQGGQPVEGVRVGLYKANELAAAAYTGVNGQARLTFDPRRLTPGQAVFTVSGDRIVPRSQNVQLVRPQRAVFYQWHTILDDNNFPRQGNGDGAPGPFERIQIVVTASNIGSAAAASPVTFTLATQAAGVRIVEERFVHQAQIAPNAMVQAAFLCDILGSFPDREAVPFTLTANSAGQDWISNFSITGRAARWSILEIDPSGALQAMAEINLDIVLKNSGSLPMGITSARLESANDFAEIIIAEASYDSAAVGDTMFQNPLFRISLTGDAPYAAELTFILRLSSEERYTADLSFSLKTLPPPASVPTGPDNYGYYAIDERDINSNLAPVERWIEINPQLQGRGVNTGLLDRGEDLDASVVLNLPFTFQYYGRRYTQLTVCTNGWAAFGDQRNYVDFRNLPIGSPQGPAAQLCPWWDDLYTPFNECAIYYHSDTANHRFIVQWHRMRRWIGPDGPGSVETFQVVLFDPAWHPTYTGDGDIQFNYRDVTHEAHVDGNGTPYATIGIGDPTDRGGLQYGFWDSYAPGASRPGTGAAIRFATAAQHEYGRVTGQVKAVIDSLPIAGAVARSTRGGWTTTNEDGYFNFTRALAGLPFNLIAAAPGFNPRASGELNVRANDSLTVEIYLTQPQFEMNVDAIEDSLNAGEISEAAFQIANSGNGELTFACRVEPANPNNAHFRFRSNGYIEPCRDEPDEPWSRLFTLNVSALTGDQRILGAAFTGDRFVISGGNNGENDNFLYRFNRLGVRVDQIEQPCSGAWGMHDLAWDGRDFYGGCDDAVIRFDINGREINRISSPISPPRALTVDPAGNIWTTTPGAAIYKLSPQGQTLRTYSQSLRPYGLAWHPADKDGCPLWVFSADGASNLAISKMDTANGSFRPVAELTLNNGDRAGGCEISGIWDDRVLSFIAVIQNPDGDRVEVLEIEPNLSWLQVAPASGAILPQDVQNCSVSLSAADLRGGDYLAEIVIAHNAADGMLRLPVHLFVSPLFSLIDDRPPTDYNLISIYPNPVNGRLTIRYALDEPTYIDLIIYNMDGREVFNRRIANTGRPNNIRSEAVDVSHLSSGLYFIRLQNKGEVITRKFVLLK
ncbi:MAG: T9SS type A sorting domain-containing protein [Calditrichaeota bacterium]|nr:T9SS type A sorting domain-containing protein [Calditrichota bacterium]